MAEGVSSCESNLAAWTPFAYLDNDDDDDDGVMKPSDLYGKCTWKIDNYSRMNEREIRSSSFVVGGCKWYILVYPQGCDVCNHLSLFLCVADHDKLLPDTLHRFWKKEHDWGWRKFMELSKLREVEGFIDADSLIVKAQVQVIRERPDRFFRCLDSQYRKELTRVYLFNVEQISRRFVEGHRAKLRKLLDKARWSSFRAFWLGMVERSRGRMSREKSKTIMKLVVKHFFIEKEVTSTLVMDTLYDGLKPLEHWNKGKHLEAEELRVPIVGIEENTFILVDDLLLLLERAAMEPLPSRNETAPREKIYFGTATHHLGGGTAGEEPDKRSFERDEARVCEFSRRAIEIFVFAHIFSKIEVAHQEAVVLKEQKDLICELEAWVNNKIEKKSRGVNKGKKSRKKSKGNRDN